MGADTAPVSSATGAAALNSFMAGIERIAKRRASCGFSSTFTFATLTRPQRCCATAFRTGSIDRQGPHHGAQKSTSTGMGEDSTASAKLESVTTTGLLGASGCLQRAQRAPTSVRPSGIRFRPRQWVQRCSSCVLISSSRDSCSCQFRSKWWHRDANSNVQANILSRNRGGVGRTDAFPAVQGRSYRVPRAAELGRIRCQRHYPNSRRLISLRKYDIFH